MHLNGMAGDLIKGLGCHLLVGRIISGGYQKRLGRRYDGPGIGAVDELAFPEAGKYIDPSDGHEIPQYFLPQLTVRRGVNESGR